MELKIQRWSRITFQYKTNPFNLRQNYTYNNFIMKKSKNIFILVLNDKVNKKDEDSSYFPAISNLHRDSSSNTYAILGLNLDSSNFPPLIDSLDSSRGEISGSTQIQIFVWSCEIHTTSDYANYLKLKFEDPKDFNGESKDVFTSGDLNTSVKVCESFVVGYFIGKKLAFQFVKKKLTVLWNTKGDFSIPIYGDQAYFFKFVNDEDKSRIL